MGGMTPLLAHETWFTDGDGRFDWSFLFEGTTLALLAVAVFIAAAVRFVNRYRDGVDVRWLAAMAPYMPFAVRLHLSAPLIGLLSLGFYLSPAMDLEADLAGILLGAVMAVVAVGMATGYRTRAACVAADRGGAAGNARVRNRPRAPANRPARPAAISSS